MSILLIQCLYYACSPGINPSSFIQILQDCDECVVVRWDTGFHLSGDQVMSLGKHILQKQCMQLNAAKFMQSCSHQTDKHQPTVLHCSAMKNTPQLYAHVPSKATGRCKMQADLCFIGVCLLYTVIHWLAGQPRRVFFFRVPSCSWSSSSSCARPLF